MNHDDRSLDVSEGRRIADPVHKLSAARLAQGPGSGADQKAITA
jgi:hypothetical protein